MEAFLEFDDINLVDYIISPNWEIRGKGFPKNLRTTGDTFNQEFPDHENCFPYYRAYSQILSPKQTQSEQNTPNSKTTDINKTKEIIENKTKEIIENKTDEIIENRTKEIIENNTKEIIENKTKEIIENNTKEIIENKTDEIIENRTKEIIENNTKEIIENNTDEIIENNTKEIIENKTNEIFENINNIENNLQFNFDNQNIQNIIEQKNIESRNINIQTVLELEKRLSASEEHKKPVTQNDLKLVHQNIKKENTENVEMLKNKINEQKKFIEDFLNS